MLCFSLFISFIACERSEEITPSEDLISKKSETELEIIEKELGVKLFKTVEKIADDYGNEIQLTIASPDEAQLREYLSNVELGIKVYFADEQSENNLDKVKIDESKDAEEKVHPNKVSNLYFEVLSIKYAENVSRIRLKSTPIKRNQFLNSGFSSRYGYTTTFISGKHIEGFKVWYNSINCSSCSSDIKVYHYYRPGWFGWKYYRSWTMFPGEFGESCKDSRKTKTIIKTWHPFSTYDIDHDFWNCA